MPTKSQSRSKGLQRWLAWLIGLPVVYLLSSGPVLGLAFYLRETTGWDGFYAAMYFYYPILALGHGGLMSAYIEWWVVDVFQTVGPG